MAKTNVPKKVLDLLAEVGLSTHQAGWDCHGTWVMYHKAAEKLAGYKKVKFDKPEIIHQDVGQKEVVMLVTGHCGGITEWSFGEATPSNNKNAYPYAMAEKRAKDRVILKLLGFHGDVYTDTEIDDQVQQQLKRQAERNIENTSEQEVKEQEKSSTSNNSSPVPMSSSKMFDKIKKHIDLIQRKGYKENKEQLQHEELVAYFVECNDTHFKTMDKKHVEDLTKEFFRIEKELKFYIERAK